MDSVYTGWTESDPLSSIVEQLQDMAMAKSPGLKMRIVYGYTDRADKWFSGCIDGTVEDALEIFSRFDGNAARFHVLVDEHFMIGWHMHGPKLYEVQLMDDQRRRKRIGQVPNQFAENCIRRVFEGDLDLEDLEENAWFYSAGEWEPKADQDYWFYRSLKPNDTCV